jgi:acetyl esterase
MDFESIVDPDILAVFDELPDGFVASIATDPSSARATFAFLMEQMAGMLPPTDVTVTETSFEGPDGEVQVVIYQPATEAPRPGLLWLHGGGYVIGNAYDPSAILFAEHAGCTVVSVDYRLAPEYPFPAGPEDSYAALQWMVENAEELGIDPDNIAIGGSSAGGGMAAGVALMNRDRGGPDLKLQLLLYPMIDDTHETPSGHLVNYPNVWNRDVSLAAWRMYLGDMQGNDVSPYAAVARATDLSDLPPVYLCVGTADLFRDENIDYAKRLMEAGVPTELVVYPGMPHGGEAFSPMIDMCRRMSTDYIEALSRAFA